MWAISCRLGHYKLQAVWLGLTHRSQCRRQSASSCGVVQAEAVEAAKAQAQELEGELKGLKKQVTRLATEGSKAAAAREAACTTVAVQEGERGNVLEAAAMAQVLRGACLALENLDQFHVACVCVCAMAQVLGRAFLALQP